ncbi:unnamed protein product [Dicrocoelium dendriticum]|nr:unnamed protein product [Dicrocoelium dendriticum]
MTHKVKCIPWVHGELVIQPNHDLIFEGSFDLPFSSNICLTNPSGCWMKFTIETSSTHMSVFPSNGDIAPGNMEDLLVIQKPLKSIGAIENPDIITVWEASYVDLLVNKMWKKSTKINCVYIKSKTESSVNDFQQTRKDLQDVD